MTRRRFLSRVASCSRLGGPGVALYAALSAEMRWPGVPVGRRAAVGPHVGVGAAKTLRVPRRFSLFRPALDHRPAWFLWPRDSWFQRLVDEAIAQCCDRTAPGRCVAVLDVDAIRPWGRRYLTEEPWVPRPGWLVCLPAATEG